MNKFVKKGLCLVLATGLIASTFAGCAKVSYVTNGAIKAIHEIKDGSWLDTGEEEGTGDTDAVVLEKEFEAGTYGGVEFKTVEDVVAYYAEAYKNTKAKTAEYVDDEGNTQVLYDLIGTEDLIVGDVMIDGKANAVVNKLVPTIVGKLFTKGGGGLPPYYSRNPEDDNNLNDDTRKQELDFRTCFLTADDILACNVTDNGDGTITIQIQPNAADMSLRGEDSQGRFFEVLGDIGGVVASIDQISFSTGDAADNVKVKYIGGTGTIKINTKTKEVVEADYNMKVNVAVTHANLAGVIKDKSASLGIDFNNHYPADETYLKESLHLTRK